MGLGQAVSIKSSRQIYSLAMHHFNSKHDGKIGSYGVKLTTYAKFEYQRYHFVQRKLKYKSYVKGKHFMAGLQDLLIVLMKKDAQMVS